MEWSKVLITILEYCLDLQIVVLMDRLTEFVFSVLGSSIEYLIGAQKVNWRSPITQWSFPEVNRKTEFVNLSITK